MKESTRRGVISGFATSAVFLSGCSALTTDSTDDTFQFSKLELWNDDDEPHRLHLVVEADGEPIYWGSYEIPSNPGDVVGEKEFDPGTRLDGKIQQLTVRGRVDDRPAVGPVKLTSDDVTDPAVVNYVINEDLELDIKTRIL
jgi:hypothetical protein